MTAFGASQVPDIGCQHGHRLRECPWPACIETRTGIIRRARRHAAIRKPAAPLEAAQLSIRWPQPKQDDEEPDQDRQPATHAG